jgi:hypothetical protein
VPTPDAALNYPAWCLSLILKSSVVTGVLATGNGLVTAVASILIVSLPFPQNLLVFWHHPEWQKPSWDISFGGNLK